MFALPGFAIQWQPTKVEVARSGGLAFAQGTYEMTMTGPQGSPVTDRGKYIDVWKKQADGAWKVVADIFNSDMPLPAPPSSK
jgi:ketosteroid isomerase-like protein